MFDVASAVVKEVTSKLKFAKLFSYRNGVQALK